MARPYESSQIETAEAEPVNLHTWLIPIAPKSLLLSTRS